MENVATLNFYHRTKSEAFKVGLCINPIALRTAKTLELAVLCANKLNQISTRGQGYSLAFCPVALFQISDFFKARRINKVSKLEG